MTSPPPAKKARASIPIPPTPPTFSTSDISKLSLSSCRALINDLLTLHPADSPLLFSQIAKQDAAIPLPKPMAVAPPRGPSPPPRYGGHVRSIEEDILNEVYNDADPKDMAWGIKGDVSGVVSDVMDECTKSRSFKNREAAFEVFCDIATMIAADHHPNLVNELEMLDVPEALADAMGRVYQLLVEKGEDTASSLKRLAEVDAIYRKEGVRDFENLIEDVKRGRVASRISQS